MFDNEFDKGHLIRMDDGSLVERDVLNIVQRIHEYDSNLRVQYLERAASLGDAPYRIVEHCKDGKDRVVFYAWALDERVLDRLYAADTHIANIMGRLDTNNQAVRREAERRYRDRLGEANDIMRTMLKSPKGRWSFREEGKKITVDDDPTSGPYKVEEIE